MYPVTEQWKAEENKTLRNHSYVRIVFGITDPDAPGLSTPSDNGHLLFSDVGSVDIDTSAPSTYASLEWNRFILDGKNPLPVEVNSLYQGYVGSGISGADGVWAVQPKIEITFVDYVQFPALNFQFDESMDEYPERMQIVVEHDGMEVFNMYAEPQSAYWVFEEHIVFAWFDKDISAIVSCNYLLFGTELGVCGLMKIFDKRVEHQEKQAEESRMRAEKRRKRKTAKDTEAKREYEKMRG